MSEQYVSFETSKLLKENGFDEKTVYHYTNCDVLQHNIVYNEYKNSEMLNAYSAPTQQMACRWLREEYYIDILPLVRHVNKFAGELPIKEYSYRIYDSEGNVIFSGRDWSRSYEKSIETALEYVLKNII